MRIGLVETVLPDDGFMDEALAFAASIAGLPRTAVVAAKRAIIEGLRLPLDDGLRFEAGLFIECQVGPDALRLEQAAADRYRDADPDEPIGLA